MSNKNKKEIKCEKCGECCNYCSIKIKKPKNKYDWDELFWSLDHKNVYLEIENNDWNIFFITPCLNLNEKNECKIHSEPHYYLMCSEYEPENCHLNSKEDYNNILIFNTGKELIEYKNKLKK
jgi:hypothetical protein